MLATTTRRTFALGGLRRVREILSLFSFFFSSLCFYCPWKTITQRKSPGNRIFGSLCGFFFFGWGICFLLAGGRDAPWRGGICSFRPTAVCFSGPAFFCGGREGRFPGWGPDGKLTIKFTSPKRIVLMQLNQPALP